MILQLKVPIHPPPPDDLTYRGQLMLLPDAVAHWRDDKWAFPSKALIHPCLGLLISYLPAAAKQALRPHFSLYTTHEELLLLITPETFFANGYPILCRPGLLSMLQYSEHPPLLHPCPALSHLTDSTLLRHLTLQAQIVKPYFWRIFVASQRSLPTTLPLSQLPRLNVAMTITLEQPTQPLCPILWAHKLERAQGHCVASNVFSFFHQRTPQRIHPRSAFLLYPLFAPRTRAGGVIVQLRVYLVCLPIEPNRADRH